MVPDQEVDAVDAFPEAYRRALDHVLGLPAESMRRVLTEEAREALITLGG